MTDKMMSDNVARLASGLIKFSTTNKMSALFCVHAIEEIISNPPEYQPKVKDILSKARTLHRKSTSSKNQNKEECFECDGMGRVTYINPDNGYKVAFGCPKCNQFSGKLHDRDGGLIVDWDAPPPTTWMQLR